MVICIDCGDIGMHDTYGEDEEGAIILCIPCLMKLVHKDLMNMVEEGLTDISIGEDGKPRFKLTEEGEKKREESRRRHEGHT